jgi:hypothetical protein
VLALLLYPLPSLIGGIHLVNQARELRFGCVLGLKRNHELTLKKGDPLSHLVSLPTGKSYPLHPDGPGPYHDSGRPRLSHLLPKLRHFGCVLG